MNSLAEPYCLGHLSKVIFLVLVAVATQRALSHDRSQSILKRRKRVTGETPALCDAYGGLRTRRCR